MSLRVRAFLPMDVTRLPVKQLNDGQFCLFNLHMTILPRRSTA